MEEQSQRKVDDAPVGLDIINVSSGSNIQQHPSMAQIYATAYEELDDTELSTMVEVLV